MFRIRKSKGKGYILIYILFVCSISLFIALGCYKIELLIKQNSIKMQKNILTVDKLQKSKEYLLTELDEYIYANVKDITEDEIKKLFASLDNFTLSYEESCVKYNKEKNCFLVQYNINHKFYKEEFYEYKVKETSITYGCIDYSFRKGELK